MTRYRTIATWTLTAIALVAIALWPLYMRERDRSARAASLPKPVVVTRDYESRDRDIAAWERIANRKLRGDSMSPHQLADLYLQRYRERGDIDDVLRSRGMAIRALRAQPYGNVPALVSLASAELTLHRFKAALRITKGIERIDPGDPQMLGREASLDLEIGDYTNAKRIIDRLTASGKTDIALDTLVSRYDELTGHLAHARELLERTTARQNARYDTGAWSRAWFYFRSGELAFEAGDNDGAIAFERQAIAVFPNFADALRAKAHFECANKRWGDCLASARASADIVPYPETLGYEVDAQRALGDTKGAAATDALIHTIERIGNEQHISDRLLAIYYSEHRENVEGAYAIAKRELSARDDIFSEDTLAWAAAMAGHWPQARVAIAKATQLGTENSLLLYHAGVIAQHDGNVAAAKADFTRALELNPSFHATYADDARSRLATL